MKKKLTSEQRRRFRTRNRIRRDMNGVQEKRLRLSVHRSSKQIYAQVIDDAKGVTIASASTLDADLRDKLKTGANIAAAMEVGKLVADRAKKAGVEKVVFDRGPFKYHGRVKALADGARENGLSF